MSILRGIDFRLPAKLVVRIEPIERNRRQWTDLSDEQLLAQCEVDTFRASGPGGQKRNKTSSAVRLRHLPSGLIVIAEESRSQHENKARAKRRMRQALYLKIREPATPESLSESPVLAQVKTQGRLKLGRKDASFWPVAGLVLDALAAVQARVADTARLLGITTGNLMSFLQSEPKLWEQANIHRIQFGHKNLQFDH